MRVYLRRHRTELAEAVVNETRPKGAAECRPETDVKYRPALDLYRGTDLPVAEICRRCSVSPGGFSRYIRTYHRHLMLRRNGVRCGSPEEALGIRLGQRRGQRPETHVKYREAIAACDSMEYVGYNVSQIAREFGLSGADLSRQLHTHYPEILEFRERARQSLGLDDGLPRGARQWSRKQYAGAVDLLSSDRYITVQDAAGRCAVSSSGLEQHLVFYHKELVENRIRIRRRAVGQRRRGGITGRGTLHAPAPEIVGKYAEALRLYRTTTLSAREIARRTNVSAKGFYGYLRTWHMDAVCARKGVSYGEGVDADLSALRRYSPAAAEKYAAAIARLKEGGLSPAKAASEFGLHPECFRQYLKEHEPELYSGLGMRRTERGGLVSSRSMEKYREALRLYETTSESLKSIARRFGLNDSSLRQFIRRQFPGLLEKRKGL